METKEIKIYKFEELKKEVQELVIERRRENLTHDFLEENMREYLTETLNQYKIEELGKTTIRYSLSYSQGDGFSFTGLFKYKGNTYSLSLGERSNYYCHSNTINIALEDDENEISTEAEEEFKELFFKICKDLENVGYEEIEREESEENIKEEIEMNELTFRENGEVETL